MGYTVGKVRYHTTLKDIAVSVLVLISCAIICLYGMVRLGMANPSQYIADRLMNNLNSGGPVSFKAESLDRMFLKNLVINEPSISLAENNSASASDVQIHGGLPLLLSSYLFGSKQVTVSVLEPELVINESLKNLSFQTSSSNSHLKTWLESNTFSIETQNLRASMDFSDLAAKLEMSSFDLVFDNNKPFPTIRGSAPILSFDTGKLKATFLETDLGLDEAGNALIKSSKVSLLQQGLEVSFNQLVALGTLESLSLAHSDATINLSLADLQAERERFTVSVPTLTSNIQLKNGVFDSATVSYDQFALGFGDIHMLSPTATVTGKKEGEKLLLGFATKQGDLFKITYGRNLMLDLQTLQANAQYEANNAAIQLSLGQVHYAHEDFEAALTSLYLQANGQMEGTKLIDGVLDLQADALAAFRNSNIFFSSPLISSLTYRESDASISSSAYFTNLASSFTTMPLSARLSFQSNRQGSQLQAELDYQNMLTIRSVYDMPASSDGTFFFTSRFNSFPLSILSPTFESYVPFIKPYYQLSTNLIGNISFQSALPTMNSEPSLLMVPSTNRDSSKGVVTLKR